MWTGSAHYWKGKTSLFSIGGAAALTEARKVQFSLDSLDGRQWVESRVFLHYLSCILADPDSDTGRGCLCVVVKA